MYKLNFLISIYCICSGCLNNSNLDSVNYFKVGDTYGDGVQYFDMDPDLIIPFGSWSVGSSYFYSDSLDIDFDGIYDLLFGCRAGYVLYDNIGNYYWTFISSLNNVYAVLDTLGYPMRFYGGEVLSDYKYTLLNSNYTIYYASAYLSKYYGNWLTDEAGYLALKIENRNSTKYCWIQLKAGRYNNPIEVCDFAWCE